jgi:hypothetical protein
MGNEKSKGKKETEDWPKRNYGPEDSHGNSKDPRQQGTPCEFSKEESSKDTDDSLNLGNILFG